MSEYRYYDNEGVLDHLVGRRVVLTSWPSLYLDDGTKLEFDTDNYDCCSWVQLTKLSECDHIITAAKFTDTDEGEGEYKAWLTVITQAGEFNVAELDGDASNGYYLHGFALGVTVTKPSADA